MRRVGSRFFCILSILCFLYCLSIGLFMGYGTSFFLIWGVLASCCALISVILKREKWFDKIPGWVKKSFCVCAGVAMVLLLLIEGMILSHFSVQAKGGADYVIVLGAQWKSSGPSYVLRKRLDKAVEYLQTNPDTQVIVSGGQGPNEPIAEADGMYEYLVEAGISRERIRKEDRSSSTFENLAFSSKLLDKRQDHVVLVTNNFHVFRALGLAKKQGYAQVEGLAAASYPAMLPNNLLREFLGVIKDFLVGNL